MLLIKGLASFFFFLNICVFFYKKINVIALITQLKRELKKIFVADFFIFYFFFFFF